MCGSAKKQGDKKIKPVNWTVSDPCAFHGFVQAGLPDVHDISDFERLVAQAGERWGCAPSREVGPPPSPQEKMVTRAIQVTSGLGRWLLVQRLWTLRRTQQRLRAQSMVRETLAHPERGGWGGKYLPGPFGCAGVWYFMQGSECVRDREQMSAMLLKTFGDLFKDDDDDLSTRWIWKKFDDHEIPEISAELIQKVVSA